MIKFYTELYAIRNDVYYADVATSVIKMPDKGNSECDIEFVVDGRIYCSNPEVLDSGCPKQVEFSELIAPVPIEVKLEGTDELVPYVPKA